MMADFSHMKDIAKAVGVDLIEYLTQGHNSLSGGIVIRMFALRNFKDDVVDTPINLCWNYLILHQVIFERVAKQHPSHTELRFPGSGPSLAEIWLGSFNTKPAKLGQGSACPAREDVAHKSTIPCELKLFCALQIY
jgi:hypothetical protein